MNEHVHPLFRAILQMVAPANPADAELGMAWWNGLSERERREWMRRAGDTGVAADAREAFKRSQDQINCDGQQ